MLHVFHQCLRDSDINSVEQRSKVLESTSDNRECPDGSSQGDNPVVNKDGEDGLNASPSVEQCVCAKFHFVDLAGSERANKTGNKGERFKGTYSCCPLLHTHTHSCTRSHVHRISSHQQWTTLSRKCHQCTGRLETKVHSRSLS